MLISQLNLKIVISLVWLLLIDLLASSVVLLLAELLQLWEVYNERRCVRTYLGHREAVRDICFNIPGTKFLSCSYDRYCKLWDTETGLFLHCR